jgi:DNA-binding NtrC family response regulator
MPETNNFVLLLGEHEEDIRNNIDIPFQNIIIVNTVCEAKNVIKNYHIDIVITELNLKDCRGLDIIVQLRNVFDGIIISVCCGDNIKYGVSSVEKGADDFINCDNLNKENLKKLIHKILNHRNAKTLMSKINDKLNSIIAGSGMN